MRMMTASPRSVFNQIISSRERKRPAVFFVMILEQGPCKNIAVVECVLADNVKIYYCKDISPIICSRQHCVFFNNSIQDLIIHVDGTLADDSHILFVCQ